MLKTFITLAVTAALGILVYHAYQGGFGIKLPFAPLSQQSSFPYKNTNDTCYLDYFKEIVMIIVFNYPYYDSVPILTRFYKPIFPKLFICGPRGNKSVPNVTHVFINKGIYGYQCLAEAIRKYPGNEGYFYINDDVILNYWNLAYSRFNKGVIWRSNNQFGRIDLKKNLTQPWYWWVSPYGVNNTKLAIKEIQRFGTQFKMYKDMFIQYKNNGNGSYYAYSGRSDIFYIPRKYSIKFQELAQIFYRNAVFLEIAVPTIIQFLASREEVYQLPGYYIPGDVRKNDPRVIDSRYFWNTYFLNEKTWFIHPFKLHHEGDKNRELNLALLEHILIRKTTDFISRC